MELMRKSGFIAHTVIKTLCDAAEPGMTTDELDRLGAQVLDEHGAISMNRWYPTYKPGEGYPATICISVNDEVVHGIPSKRKLENGDVVTFDLGMKFQNHCADHAWTVGIGDVDEESARLIEHGKSTLRLALETMEPGRKWSDIARLMQHHAEEAGYGVVQEFVGHGIGKSMHEDPKVPNFVTPEQLKSDFTLRPGLTVAVEPMLIVGPRYVEQLDDEWTIVAKNGGKACHFEHTVAVTADGVDVLTDGREAWGI